MTYQEEEPKKRETDLPKVVDTMEKLTRDLDKIADAEEKGKVSPSTPKPTPPQPSPKE